MKFVKENKEEKRYFVQEIAQAIGLSEGAIRSFFSNKGKSTKDGLTLEDIVAVIERDRTRGDGIDFGAVSEIRTRLINEKGYRLDFSDEMTYSDALKVVDRVNQNPSEHDAMTLVTHMKNKYSRDEQQI